MKISSEFSKYASSYGSYNIIQDSVAKKLLSTLAYEPKNILDLGCGSGAICKNIDWRYKHFTGIDFAAGMLEIHPKAKNIECIYGDFNDDRLFENLLTYQYEHIFSASALQWSQNLEATFRGIKLLKAPVSLAIFTSGTFATLNKTAALNPLLRDAKTIKKSGVSGSRKLLSYKQTKKLMQEYPLNYLEFEVAFITSR